VSGPPRTPTQIRRTKGNPGKRAYNKREPKLKLGTPDMPDHIRTDEIAKPEWVRLTTIAAAAEVLTKAERSIIELACVAYSDLMRARKAIAKHGQTYETTNQQGDMVIKSRPEVAIAADAWRRYRAAVCELGFTPAARAKVSTVDPGEEQSPEEKYFN
jgi:P27 family predicted phage terminase small subunit